MTRLSEYHTPVLTEETIALLQPERGDTFLDGTVGGGGHAAALLARNPDLRLIALDRDPAALVQAAARLAPFGDRVRLVRGNFADAPSLAGISEGTLAGVLLDLGVSSHQIDVPERGFTFRPGAPLDMRMAGAADGTATAAELLNTLSSAQLRDIFRRYGDERRARRLAETIVRMRSADPFGTSDHLIEAVQRTLGAGAGPKDNARIFQALRIAVNDELEALGRALPAVRELLAPGGIFAVLAYHSLEDRLVKNAFRDWSRECVCPPRVPLCRCRGRPLGETLTRKAVRASAEEVRDNVRARSVRLRAWRRV